MLCLRHRCVIKPGHDGVCRVRFNEAGTLKVPFGYVAGVACDPIEKKPFFHVKSGCDALTFGMLGCDYHCGYCQNWVTSQMLRDVDAVAPPKLTNPAQLADLAVQYHAGVVASSYNEPLITSEWAVAVFKEARQRGLPCVYISNGNATPQVLDYLRPHVDAYKVDLKTFNPKHYRQLGGVMEHVIETIRMLKQRGFWVEIVTLVVPGFSDDADDLKRMADFLASVDPLMPWHMTAFHPDYKMTDGFRQTTVDDLMKIVEMAGGGSEISLSRQPARHGGGVGKHPLPSLPCHGHQAVWLPRAADARETRWIMPRLRWQNSRHLGVARRLWEMAGFDPSPDISGVNFIAAHNRQSAFLHGSTCAVALPSRTACSISYSMLLAMRWPASMSSQGDIEM